MGKIDHAYPAGQYKDYLEGTGKFLGNKACSCIPCLERRQREHDTAQNGNTRNRESEVTK